MSVLPSIFLSHGAPDLPLRDSPVRTFLSQLGSQLGQPQGILCISAHQLARIPTVSTDFTLTSEHDYWGFAAETYKLHYQTVGSSQLAEQVIQQLAQVGITAQYRMHPRLDHGTWQPLMLMYPQQSIPLVLLSVQPYQDPAYHFRLGQALAELRQQNILILGSGGITHNLQAFGGYPYEAHPVAWAEEFDRWLGDAIAQNRTEELLQYRDHAPYAEKNHPTDEHLLPLFVAMGAGGQNAKGQQLHHSFAYGIFSLAAYAFA